MAGQVGDELKELRERNRRLEAEMDSIKAQINAKDKTEQEAKHEATVLRSELDHVYKKLEHARKVKDMCSKTVACGSKVLGWGKKKSDGMGSGMGSFDFDELGPNDTMARMRSISDAVMQEAEDDLHETMKSIQEETESLKTRTRCSYVVLVVLVILLLPGILLTLRDAGMVDIKKGNILSDIVNEWEAQSRNGVHAIRMFAKATFTNQAVCAREKQPEYHFNHREPPLMTNGFDNINQTEMTVVGEAALRICTNGTSDMTFLRRDDCDGCLCASGTVYIYFKDPRFFGTSDHCVTDKQWKDCINKWTFGLHRPNFCWEFIWNGGRQDPTCDSPKVITDSCSLHHGCFIMAKRWRQWVLIKDFWADRDMDMEVVKDVGILEKEIASSNRTIKIDLTKRAWGFPASVQTLLKVGPTSGNIEWQSLSQQKDVRPFAGGKQHKIWQLRSLYIVTGVDMQGVEYMMTNWTQWEYALYVDSMQQ